MKRLYDLRPREDYIDHEHGIMLCNDSYQNFKTHPNIPKAQLILSDIPYAVGNDAYGSNPKWYIDGDNRNGESDLAGKAFFDSDYTFKVKEFLHFASQMLQPEPKTEIEEISELDKLQPFDRVVVRDGLANWQVDFFVAIGDSKELGRQYVCIGSSWDECHSYEPWMNKYIGSKTPFCDWKKEE